MQDTHITYFDKRASGISLVGDLPWGSHFCQFYHTQEDLLETLVPYFRAGLENNESCVWVAGSPLDAEKANKALRIAVPRFEEHARKGQAEIISRDEWHAGDAESDTAIVARLDRAISRGFDGLRLAYNAFPEGTDGRAFAGHRADAICKYNVIAVFAYPRDEFDAIGLMEVVKNHRLALVKNAGRWEVIESSEARTVKDALRRSEEKLHSVFANMSEGYAYHRIVLDAQGDPCDYVFLEVNEAFERLTGLKSESLIGKRATEVLPGIEKDPVGWIRNYGKVATSGKPMQFESYSQSLGRWYSISAFSPHKGFFAVTFSDITERKAADEVMRNANQQLQSQAEELQAQAEELQTQTEELNVQAEELRAANEELRNSERALREAHERAAWLARFPDENPNAVMRVSIDGSVLYRNPVTARLPGWGCQVGRPLPESLLPLVEQAMTQGEVAQQDVQFGVRLYSVSAVPFPRERYVNIYGRDVTERRQAEEALRDSEQRLSRAQEIAHLGSWELDLVSGALTWSDEVYRIFGLSPREFAASYEAFLNAIHPGDRADVDAAYSGSLQEGKLSYEIEHRVVRAATGEIRWVHEKCQHVTDAAGKIIRSLGMVLDITERRRMEDQLRRLNDHLEEEVQAQTEELQDTVDRLQDEMTRRVGAEGKLRKHAQMLEGFFQHTISPLAFMDPHFNFIRVNEAYAAADGKDPSFFVGRNHFVLYPEEENRAIFERVVQTKQSYRAFARQFQYSDAPRRGVTYWNWLLTPLLDEQGEVQFLVLNLEDVTERQKAFAELEHRARQLQQLTLELSQAEDRERRRLAEILHDDLQQQLAAAKFHLGILGGRIKDNVSVRSMVGQLDQILKDAIDKSRSLSHELSPAVLYQSDLSETFEWLAHQLQTKHGLTVYVDAVEPVHLQSEAMKTFLFKAAQEILFNVVKHARVKEARLRLRRSRGSLRLTIADQGQGFDPQTLRKAGGFGLLSIRERIELLGGRMRVKSVQGQGSVFAIAISDGPLCNERQNARRKEGRNEEGPDVLASDTLAFLPSSSRPRLRVVLADDHKVMREGLAALLSEQPDMDIVGQAGNGREAVNLTYTLHPDVVIMDIAMPVMAGDEATRQIKLHIPQTRVIALSMFEEAGVAEMVRRAGAETYLLKTAPFEELLAAVRGQTPS